MNEIDILVDECVDKIGQRLDAKVTIGNVIALIVTSMEVVETYSKINGAKKKEVVLSIIQKLIRDSDHDELMKECIGDILDKVGEPCIDAIIIASKGRLFLNLRKSIYKTIKQCCIGSSTPVDDTSI